MSKLSKPAPEEYGNFYRGYIDQVGDADILMFLEQQTEDFLKALDAIPEDKLGFAYAPGKWTVAELLGHMIDVERVMAYRLLRFSRQDKTPIPGFEQDDYVKYGRYNERSKISLYLEFAGLRASNLELACSLSAEQGLYTGESNGVIFSVRALLYVIAGHLAHHWGILKERYQV